MLRARLREHIRTLGLIGLTDEDIDANLAWATAEAPSYLAFSERFLAGAAARKRERSVKRRIDQSGLRHHKTLEAFDWAFQPRLDRRVIEEIATLGFLDRIEDILFTGKTGTGKSHILQAIALRACQADFTVRYARCVDLIDDLYAGLADGTYPRRLDRWCRPRLLVIDDVGLGQLKRTDDEPTAAHLLFNLVDRRHELTSTAVSSNLKLSAWGQYLGDSMMAAAILDRLAEHSIRVDIDGPSYRQHRAHQRSAGARPATRSATEPTHRSKEPKP